VGRGHVSRNGKPWSHISIPYIAKQDLRLTSKTGTDRGDRSHVAVHVTLSADPQGVWQTADPNLIHAETPKCGCGFHKNPVGRPTNYPHQIPTSQLPKVSIAGDALRRNATYTCATVSPHKNSFFVSFPPLSHPHHRAATTGAPYNRPCADSATQTTRVDGGPAGRRCGALNPPPPYSHALPRRLRQRKAPHRRCKGQPEQNAILFGRLLPKRRPTDAILFQYRHYSVISTAIC